MTLQGQLLVASPALGDPNFERTVVLVLAHGDDGAVGVVLNRPSDLSVDGAVPGWDGRAGEPRVLFVGGPVSPDGLIALGQAGGGAREDAWSEVVDGVGTIDLDVDPHGAAGIDEVRLFAGYAGWGPGQLEGEIEANAWFVVPARGTDALSRDPDRLWSDVLRRQRGQLAILSTYPADLELN